MPSNGDDRGVPMPKADVASATSDSAGLDLLRSCAVVFVVVSHLRLFFQIPDRSPFVWGFIGHWGVLIFFLHTSLVLMLSLERQLRRRPDGGLFFEFMVRRAFRILPLSTLLILVVWLLDLPVGHLRDGRFVPVSLSPLQLVYNLLLVQNITHTESVIAPLWSLPYELQMYLVLPALFHLVRRCRTVYPPLFAWGAWAAGVWFLSRSGPGWLKDIVGFGPYFLVGIVAYQVVRIGGKKWPFFWWPYTLAATTLVYLLRPSDPVGMLCTLVLGLTVMRFRDSSEGKLRTLCRLIARYSYGIYLSHFILIWLVFWELPIASWPARWLLLLLTTVVVPIALYHGLEAPMIALGARLARRRSHPVGESAFPAMYQGR
jgi:peptidoglycan/LPS O-acetylase OafA/YrhL